MKKKLYIILLGILTFCTTSCSLINLGSEEEIIQTETQYTIQYTDHNGIQTISVESGDVYSISSIPQKEGYTFTGLFDAEIGGTQYVTSSGNSLSAFSDNKNIVLFAQYAANTYKILFDYQDAAVTGIRSLSVNYGESIYDLPLDLTLDDKEFAGWYTAPDKGGIQIADKYGLLPLYEELTSLLVDFADSNNNITLYAGFSYPSYEVTLYIDGISSPEIVKVEWGTSVSDIQFDTRVNGMAVYTWTKTQGSSEAFTGKITDDTVLYSLSFAPVIDFNSNGGDEVNSIIVQYGDAIKLPTPTKENYVFSHWEDSYGNEVNITSMPQSSMQLTAVWSSMIIFDENGGTNVTDISQNTGTDVILPTTEKSGYIFAGWYDERGYEFFDTSMPSVSIKLIAKWYLIKTEIIEVRSTSSSWSSDETLPTSSELVEIDLSNIPVDARVNMKIDVEISVKIEGSSLSDVRYAAINFYNSSVLSDKNLLHSEIFTDDDEEYSKYNFSVDNINCYNMYVAFYRYGLSSSSNAADAYCNSFYLTIEYPDTSQLY